MVGNSILAMCEVQRRFRVTMDTAIEPTIDVHVGGAKILKFEEVESGLYLFRGKHNNKNINLKVSAYPFLTLASANMISFTSREVQMANKAKDMYRLMVFPGYKRYISAVRNGCILDCPINIDNIKRAIHIYDPDIATLKGKSTRKSHQILMKFHA